MSLVPPETLIAQRAEREAKRLSASRRAAGERLRRPADLAEIEAALRALRDEREAMSGRVRARNTRLRRRVRSFRWRMLGRMVGLGVGFALLGLALDIGVIR